MAVGLTTIVTSVIELLFDWADTGEIRKKCDQRPTHLFVDCSNGVDRRLRALAEQSMDDFMRRIERFPVVLMALRLLDHGARYDPKLRKLDIPTRPYATDWLNLLGELLHERRERSAARCCTIWNVRRRNWLMPLEEDYPEAAEDLRNDRAQPSPVWRLAKRLRHLQGRKNTQGNVLSLVDSSLLVDRPNGLAMKRSVMRTIEGGRKKKRRFARLSSPTRCSIISFIFTSCEPVTRAAIGRCHSRSFCRFSGAVRVLCRQAPPGMTISNELLAGRIVLFWSDVCAIWDCSWASTTLKR